MAELHANVIPPRRRILGGILGGLLALQLSATAALAWRDAPLAVTHTTTVVGPPVFVPIVVAAPAPAPLADLAPVPAARTSCPPPRSDAPILTPPHLDEAIDTIRVAPSNAGWVAAWNTEHLFVSTDAGASFRRVLDGPDELRDVTFDCYGHVIALRADRVGILDGGTEQWQRVPGIGVLVDPAEDVAERPRGEGLMPATLAGGGPDIGVVGVVGPSGSLARLAVSSDLGRTWRHRDLASGLEYGNVISARQDGNGAIHVAFPQPDCRSTGLWWGTIRGDVVREETQFDAVGHVELYGEIALGSGYWKRQHTDWVPVTGIPGDTYPDAIPGALPTFLVDGAPYRVAGGRARKLDLVARGTVQTVDRAGRIWTVLCGQPAILRRTALVATCDSPT